MTRFHDLKVLELGRVFSGPLCGMVLADLGAAVLKVERPGLGDESRSFGQERAGGRSCYFNSLNRSKKSLELDLKDDEDRELFVALLRQADVLVHNWVQASLDRLGFSYAAVSALNPRLVYCSISGYGQQTSFGDRPAQDIIAQALSGFMSLTGEPGGVPLKTAIPVVDYVTGLYAAFSIMAALYQREQTQVGQLVTVSLLESALAMTSFAAASYLSAGVVPERVGNRHAAICPYNMYATCDGHVVVAVANDAMWRRLCEALALAELADDERFRTNAARLAHQDELEVILAARLAASTTAEVLAVLEAARVSGTQVCSLAEAFSCAPVAELGQRLRWTAPEDEAIEVVSSPVHLTDVEPRAPRPPPPLGRDNDEIRKKRGW